MTYRILKLGIEAIQVGNMREGGRLVRIAIQSKDLTNAQRANGWAWLAHTLNDRQSKIRCYENALHLEPDNEYARDKLRELRAPPPPPPPPYTPPPPDGMPTPPETIGDNPIPSPRPPSPQAQEQKPIETLSEQRSPYSPPPQRRTTWKPSKTSDSARETQTATAVPVDYNNYTKAPPPTPGNGASKGGVHYRTVGIHDGPNGDATGFFMSRNGLVVTTRHAVGGSRHLRYTLADGTSEIAQVVRSWPEYDLAILHTGRAVDYLIPMANTPDIPDNAPLRAVAHGGGTVDGIKRGTRTQFNHWFATTIDTLADAGGNPIFNEQGLLVGMLTANASASAPYYFGLHSAVIRRLVREYKDALQEYEQGMAYCSACGILSRAGVYGGFYCEGCGTVLPHAEQTARFSLPNMAGLYGENTQTPCPVCGSRAGFYDGVCLRCGER